MRTLLIDNYDSFTYNLFQMLAVVNGAEPWLIHNDYSNWDQLPFSEFDNVVISPGPGHPAISRDFGLGLRAIRELDLPILGVCLGHQGICHTFGGRVGLAPEPVHGRRSQVFHGGADIFHGIPSPFAAVRYHSFIVSSLPQSLQQTAWTSTGLCMGLRHVSRPIWGVQFHPESIQTEHGHRILQNFRDITADRRPRFRSMRTRTEAIQEESDRVNDDGPSSWSVVVRCMGPKLDAESVFLKIFGHSTNAFWLDSSAVIEGTSRFSFMGDDSGPHAERIVYDVGRRQVAIERNGQTSEFDGTIFDYLERELRRRRLDRNEAPWSFMGGYVGFIGYEVKADCGGARAHVATTPDAMFLFVDRFIVFDHQENCAYAVALCTAETRDAADTWIDTTAQQVARVAPALKPLVPNGGDAPAVRSRHSNEAYLNLVEECREQIWNGESYEVCLTNSIVADPVDDPLTAYRVLRNSNPAPYAAFLRFGSLRILSASPERFLTIDPDGNVESKPIKGTQRRGSTVAEDHALRDALVNSEKNRAENLMIVDLVRNDLASVCTPGSVHVSKLFSVESYATVHQLVSTICGRLRSGVSPVACVRAAFPGGSMTGAPKRRTMEILDKVEKGPRGIYSGALGYFSLTGAVDLSIVIRTLVSTPTQVSFGIGGAVTALSDPDDELAETWLKAHALLAALQEPSATHA